MDNFVIFQSGKLLDFWGFWRVSREIFRRSQRGPKDFHCVLIGVYCNFVRNLLRVLFNFVRLLFGSLRLKYFGSSLTWYSFVMTRKQLLSWYFLGMIQSLAKKLDFLSFPLYFGSFHF